MFAGDLYRMYTRFAELQGWKVELISANASEVGGFKEVVANINGKGVFAKFKFESGVHRVRTSRSARSWSPFSASLGNAETTRPGPG